MIKRRLHLQIYFTIILSLVVVAVVTAVMFGIFGRDNDFDERFFGITAKLVGETLPPATAPRDEQIAAIRELGSEFSIDISLFNSQRRLIGAFGEPMEAPDADDEEDAVEDHVWQRHKFGSSWILRLPDGRWFGDDMRLRDHRNPLAGLLLLLTSIALGVGIASYPLVRKLTRRLETLQTSVEQMGSGDLTARAEVKGKDEVAHLAQSFNDAASKIETLVDSHKTLLANASHELRTPLSRIRLGLEMFRKTGQEKRLAALETDIAELDSLIDEILLMSRLDAGTMGTIEPDVDLLGLIAEECAHYPQARLEGDAVSLPGNTRLLQRLVRNLIGNAFKHGEPPVTISLATAGRMAVISVQDSGPGIPASEREKVFQRFYRAAGKQNVEGYGLGLPLVLQIAQAHGGSVHIADGSGCNIVVELPLEGNRQAYL